MKKKFIIIFIGLCLFSGIAAADFSPKPKPEEYPFLPEFCQPGTEAFKNSKKTMKIRGLNHYCWGLNFINRAAKQKRGSTEEQFTLSRAEGNIQYALSRMDKDHFFRPEVLLNSGIVKEKRKNYEGAVVVYMEAIEQKKDYIPAIVRLSNVYKRTGNKQLAIEVLETALKYKPDSKRLKKKLKRLNK